MDISPDSVSHKFVTKFSDGLFTKFGDLENSSPNLVINPSQKLTLNTLKLIPPSAMTSKNCLKTKYQNWYDRDCLETSSFVCELSSTVNITQDTQLVFSSKNLTASGIQFSWISRPLKKGKAQKKKVLAYEKVKRTWTGAEAYCLSKGGHLASVSSHDDLDKLKSYVKKERKTTTRLWIGGTKAETGGNWTWSDGSTWVEKQHGGRLKADQTMYQHLEGYLEKLRM